MPQKVRKQLITKYNICVKWYLAQIDLVEKTESDFLSEKEGYSEILTYVKSVLLTKDVEKEKELFNFVRETLGRFSTTYDVNVVNNIDDFKLIYFLTLYFVRDDKFTKGREELNILFFVLHKIFCRLLIIREPSVILNKLDRFFRLYGYSKIKVEYGDIGYYHTMKSVYLMQKETYRYLIEKNIIVPEESFVADYFQKVDDE